MTRHCKYSSGGGGEIATRDDPATCPDLITRPFLSRLHQAAQ